MSRVTLFDYFRSSASYRVRIALNLKGVTYERVDISLLDGDQRTPANLARNPQGFVPTLEIDGHRLTQSLAIIDYLDAKYPDPPLVSQDPATRAATLAQALVIAADIHPIDNLRVLKYLKDVLGVDQDGRDTWYRHWVAEGLRALEAMAVDAGAFLGGDRPGLADICLVPQLFNARRFSLPLDDYPILTRIDAACAALEPFAAAHPDRVGAQA
ncbi:maleylacetoacetate isomerase [Sphingomonas colocasiae]|uniref:Maleylacetoacetate isomerase n=1 Tax=Sphingomonas colocasiae TaxID=1848973 RepID=A0ABS7PYD7_9SPHN|nr:maleylacetoacetate isomerase [Sphingomonas colocasiae]MBY8826141.1 maleylacetoacetate isomerase [Sphingomonas colocasiae]